MLRSSRGATTLWIVLCEELSSYAFSILERPDSPIPCRLALDEVLYLKFSLVAKLKDRFRRVEIERLLDKSCCSQGRSKEER